MRKPLTSKCVTGRIGVFTVVEFRRARAMDTLGPIFELNATSKSAAGK